MNEELIRAQIEGRYRRKVTAHPEGIVCHHGDCDIFRARTPVCTCGLLHDLLPLNSKFARKLYSNFDSDMGKHLQTLD